MSDSRDYCGKNISISFKAKKCIHSRNCVLGLPSVFQPNMTGPWINPEGAPAEEIAAIIRTCPSGALTYSRSDSGLEETSPHINLVRLMENGPLAFHGELYLNGKETGTRAVFCRCGHSANRPFCDGSHKISQFKATGEPPSGKTEPLNKNNGPLNMTPLKDGPLKVDGNMEICSGTGRPLLRSTKTFLCRCGASKKKPFCDGSHKEIGFMSE